MPESDVLVVGGVGVDTIVRVPSLPLPDLDTVKVPPIQEYVAHTGNGVAMGLHTLGLRVHLVDTIGDDHEGRLITRHYARAGLSFDHTVHPAGTRRSVNLVDPAGRRLSLHDARHPTGEPPRPELYRPALGRVRHVHLSLVDWARYALADAVTAGLTTSTDLHNWDGRAEYRQDFAYGCDLVFLSAALLGDRVEQVADDILARGRARAVVAMDGAGGSHLKIRDQPLRHVPAVPLPPDEVVDTNGAGDSYVAAFLWAWLAGRGWQECVTAGSLGGAHAVRTAGTHTSFITAKELHDALS
ncbi:carbohydrate kinase family protein [Streptomyces sp. SL13]|uniref:Carbohydrate kinase family protein n=1 Tax=Streptantibioticus silvisoli TaxID=2705255 RepID=A0AA90KAS1_9ACTN|nr:carbohydrate kinase family protein [Streptantibioticus silvisoli]MDI5962181.1 carbohydrate kinase family protein [Streptantibioticus silvisoli]MDI5972447.1 carbohydrate kinase family protein [Streptantibioticus silvisoli]